MTTVVEVGEVDPRDRTGDGLTGRPWTRVSRTKGEKGREHRDIYRSLRTPRFRGEVLRSGPELHWDRMTEEGETGVPTNTK